MSIAPKHAALQQAVKLMREALALLDAEGELDAAWRLQWAIDLVERVPPLQPGDEIDWKP